MEWNDGTAQLGVPSVERKQSCHYQAYLAAGDGEASPLGLGEDLACGEHDERIDEGDLDSFVGMGYSSDERNFLGLSVAEEQNRGPE
jgi:hypothetical protein